MHQWASGRALAVVLREADLPAGDFVRWAKQVIDLLDQISSVATGTLATVAREALLDVRRGIVAYSGVA
jgi:ATP-dependent RNA helicase HelY